ncbi:hypothetical protein ABEV77_04030 [Bacillus subtilis]
MKRLPRAIAFVFGVLMAFIAGQSVLNMDVFSVVTCVLGVFIFGCLNVITSE